MYSAIILAGGIKKAPGAEAENEALLDIGGRPMLSYVLAAMEESGFIDKIFVVGPVGKLKHIGVSAKVSFVQGKQSIIDNIAEGIRAAATMEKVLLATADTPFLTKEAVDDFILSCRASKADLYYAVVGKDAMEKKFPQAKRTYVKLRNGIFTGGNLFMLSPLIVPRCMQFAYKVIDSRKEPLKLASLLGWGCLLKFAVGFLSLEGARRRMEELLQVRICVMETKYAEIGMDVDKEEDLAIAREYIKDKA